MMDPPGERVLVELLDLRGWHPQNLLATRFAMPPRKFANVIFKGAPSTFHLHFLYMRSSKGPKYLLLHVPIKQKFGSSEHSQLRMIVLRGGAEG